MSVSFRDGSGLLSSKSIRDELVNITKLCLIALNPLPNDTWADMSGASKGMASSTCYMLLAQYTVVECVPLLLGGKVGREC